jgi:Dyp-type peroxidase family
MVDVPRDITTEPIFPTDEIQGDILVGLVKKVEKFIFFTIGGSEEEKAGFRTLLASLPITSMQECLDQRAAVTAHKAAGNSGLLPAPGLNVAFTHQGLQVLGAQLDGAPEFAGGMAGSQTKLADPAPASWKVLGPNQPVHGVFLVTGSTAAEVDDVVMRRLAPAAANGWSEAVTQTGTVRPHPVEGHEHFGFADGVSQPAVRGRVAAGQALDPTVGPDPDQAEPGRDLLWPGEFLFGYPSQVGQFPPNEDPDMTKPGAPQEPDTDFTRNGAFLVFRRLEQKVPEFTLSVKKAASDLVAASTDPSAGEPSADLLGAQLVGRWRSGAPLINAPHADDLSVAEGTPGALAFEFDGDRQGLVCPWAAHVRKTYPRDDVRHNVGPTRDDVEAAEAFTQTHRMMRRGIAFGPEVTAEEALCGATSEERGLLFACYVTSIEDQFEFVQDAWVNSDDFVQPGSGIDAIIGQSATPGPLPFLGGMPFTGTPPAKPQLELDRFVTMQGGEYFFAPSIPTIRDLGK